MNATRSAIEFFSNAIRRHKSSPTARLIQDKAKEGGDAMRETFLAMMVVCLAEGVDWEEVAHFFASDTTTTERD